MSANKTRLKEEIQKTMRSNLSIAQKAEWLAEHLSKYRCQQTWAELMIYANRAAARPENLPLEVQERHPGKPIFNQKQ